MRKKSIFIFSFLLFFTALRTDAQYSVLLNFDSLNGQYPNGNLLLSSGKFYGMTYHGGTQKGGLVFSVDTDGTNYKDLLNFNGLNGADPKGSLIIVGKRLYGMTLGGGLHDSGVIFAIDTDGTRFKKLFDFGGTKGGLPDGSLVCAGKRLFGMTYYGGTGYGVAFSIDTDGTRYKDMIDFYHTTGQNPYGSFILSGSMLFGMTVDGGTGSGNIFRIDTAGNNYKDIFNFNLNNGGSPFGSLLLSGSKFFGMTWGGGIHRYGNIFSLDTDGNNIKDLLDFDGTNGASPWGSDVSLIGGTLYGMTELGGAYVSYGVLFSIDTSGNNYVILHDFNVPDGANPFGSLTISGHNLYGMTDYGGTNTDGVIFRYSIIPTSVPNSVQITNKVSVYPNPTDGQITFQLSISDSPWSLEIIDITGRSLLKERFTESFATINCSAFLNGIYFYRVFKDTGELCGNGN